MAQDLYTAIASGVLFPLQERIKGHDSVRRRRELERSQWLDPKAIAELQADRLRRFLVSAGRHVPYYRNLFKHHGFRADAVRGPADLATLPVLTKQDIRANKDALRAEGATTLQPGSTGGSTGEPLQFFVGKGRVTADVATRWRSMRWWDVDIGDPEVVLWGAHVELTRQDRVRGWRDRVFRSTLVSANNMTPERLDSYLDTICRVHPRIIFSHPSALAELAMQAEERRRDMASLGIRIAFLTAEQLYAHQRERIERIFGCRTQNGYGGRESGFIAQECPEGRMHINAEDIVVEVVDDRGVPLPSGEPGEVVITHLASGDFPFIRYRTGDAGILDDATCPCGRGLPLLKDIHGRADDLLLSLDGARVPGQVAVLALREVPGIRSFRIVQEARDLVRILLVKGPEFPPGTEDSIAGGLRRILGESMRVQFEVVAGVPRDPSGKYRTVVSRVGRSPILEAAGQG